MKKYNKRYLVPLFNNLACNQTIKQGTNHRFLDQETRMKSDSENKQIINLVRTSRRNYKIKACDLAFRVRRGQEDARRDLVWWVDSIVYQL